MCVSVCVCVFYTNCTIFSRRTVLFSSTEVMEEFLAQLNKHGMQCVPNLQPLGVEGGLTPWWRAA